MANLENYGMFDYQAGDSDITQYTSAEFRGLIKMLTGGNGIAVNSMNKFIPSASGLNITIGSGSCMIEGAWGYNTNPVTHTLDAESPAQIRIDRIVLEFNAASRNVNMKVLKGAASGSPSAPALTQNTGVWQVPICQVRITNGSTTALTDERVYIYSPTEVMTALNAILGGTSFVYAVYA